jgi:2-phosphosulfolactate phosphatase
MVKTIKEGSGARFFDKEKQSWSPKKDFELCLALNRFDFVLKVIKAGEYNFLEKIEI